jgi:hypothetical protein
MAQVRSGEGLLWAREGVGCMVVRCLALVRRVAACANTHHVRTMWVLRACEAGWCSCY